MNEQIKELILKAGFPKFGEMYVVSDGKELEKFAELIVRECVDLCLKQVVGSVGTYPGAHNNAVDKCINAIKDNFGVEE